MIAILIADDLDDGPTDMEIIALVSEEFDLTPSEAVDRLRTMDYETAKRGLQ